MTTLGIPPKQRAGWGALQLALWLFFWSACLFMGLLDTLFGHVPGGAPDAKWPSPVLAQVAFFVLVPAAFVLANIFLLWTLMRVSKVLIATLVLAQAFFAAAFMFMSGGGI